MLKSAFATRTGDIALNYPGLGANESGEVLDLLLDGRDDLRRGRADADEAHALANEVNLVGPVGRVDERTLEGVQSRDVGPLWTRKPRVSDRAVPRMSTRGRTFQALRMPLPLMKKSHESS